MNIMKALLLPLFLILFCLQLHAQREDIRFDSDTNRIFYIGYDNQLTVKKGATVSSANSTISKKNDTLYIVKVSPSQASKKVSITVKLKGKSVTHQFQCKILPSPVLLMGNYELKSGEHKQNIIAKLASNGLTFGYTKDVQVYSKFFLSMSCNIEILVNNEVVFSESTSTGSFSKNLIKKLTDTKNYTMKITNIIVTTTAAKMKSSDVIVNVK